MLRQILMITSICFWGIDDALALYFTAGTLLIETLCNYDYLLQNRRGHSKESYDRHPKGKDADELWWIYARRIKNTDRSTTPKLTFLNFLPTVKLRCSYIMKPPQLIKNPTPSRQQHGSFITGRPLWPGPSGRFWSYSSHYCSLLPRNHTSVCFVQPSRIGFKLSTKMSASYSGYSRI